MCCCLNSTHGRQAVQPRPTFLGLPSGIRSRPRPSASIRIICKMRGHTEAYHMKTLHESALGSKKHKPSRRDAHLTGVSTLRTCDRAQYPTATSTCWRDQPSPRTWLKNADWTGKWQEAVNIQRPEIGMRPTLAVGAAVRGPIVKHAGSETYSLSKSTLSSHTLTSGKRIKKLTCVVS